MRLWTVHPKFLDAKGLVALWREGLLEKAVLEEKTVGYRNHPQRIRFCEHAEPIVAVCEYYEVYSLNPNAEAITLIEPSFRRSLATKTRSRRQKVNSHTNEIIY